MVKVRENRAISGAGQGRGLTSMYVFVGLGIGLLMLPLSLPFWNGGVAARVVHVLAWPLARVGSWVVQNNADQEFELVWASLTMGAIGMVLGAACYAVRSRFGRDQ